MKVYAMISALLLAGAMAKADVKVGYVDMQKAVQATAEGKKAKAELEGEFEKKKKELSYTPEPAEKALIEALDSAEPKAAAAVQAEDFEAAMAALASLRAPIDKFFDEVTVNDADPAKRSARLDLLGRFRAAVHEVADFSKIEG